jgi:GMP synthase (glutamine-hydrolysing)
MMKPVLAFRHVRHEHLGSLEGIFRRCGLVFQYIDVLVDTPRTFQPERLSGLVVLGGPMNVDETDRHPALAAEVGWIREAVDVGLPVLGICLGSQLLAKALGARVYPNHIKEIGWYPLELTPQAASDRLFAGCSPRQSVFQWHGDTFDLPSGAVHLAASELCAHQAFRFGELAYALQFHLEVTAELIDEWLVQPDNHRELAALNYIDPNQIRRRTPQEMPALASLGEQVLTRFAQLCTEQTAIEIGAVKRRF